MIGWQTGVAEDTVAEQDVLGLSPRLKQAPESVRKLHGLDRRVGFGERHIHLIDVMDAAARAHRDGQAALCEGSKFIRQARARDGEGIAEGFAPPYP